MCRVRFTDECGTSIFSYPKKPDRCCEIFSDKLSSRNPAANVNHSERSNNSPLGEGHTISKGRFSRSTQTALTASRQFRISRLENRCTVLKVHFFAAAGKYIDV